MPNVSVQNLSQLQPGDWLNLVTQLQNILNDFQDQLNDAPSLYGKTDNTQPKGLRSKDFVGQYNPSDDSFTFGIYNGERVVPLTPSELNISFTDETGTISATQHGDLSAASLTTMHSMGQISGSITAAQHGQLANGLLHEEVNDTKAGFMGVNDHALLGTVTTLPDANSLVQRKTTGGIRADGYYDVNNNLVVGTRTGPVYDATGTLANVINQFNHLLFRLRTHGLINAQAAP